MAKMQEQIHPKGGDSEPSFGRIPFKIVDPNRIPAERYYDQEVFRLEGEKLWPRVWQLACRLEEIPQIGDWVEYKILDQSVIVVRTKGGVKGYHNACRHRGVPLVSGHGSCRDRGFICPFHGWRWNIDGSNSFVFGRHLFAEENLNPPDLNLKDVRVELWGGCAFVNFDKDAAPLLECIAPLAARFEHRKLENLRIEAWYSILLPANWKLAMEAFMEGYHVMRTHPQLQEIGLSGLDFYGSAPGRIAPPINKSARQLVEQWIAYFDELSKGMGGGMVHLDEIAIAKDIKDAVILPDDPNKVIVEWMRQLRDEITKRYRARGVAQPDLNRLATESPIKMVQFAFPNYFMLPIFTSMSAYRIRPLGPESCLFELFSLAPYAENETRDRAIAPTPIAPDDPALPDIPMQDFSNIPLQQRGVHSTSFEYMRLSKSVEGMISNYQRLIDGFLSDVGREKLVKGMQIASGEFDDIIRDIGF